MWMMSGVIRGGRAGTVEVSGVVRGEMSGIVEMVVSWKMSGVRKRVIGGSERGCGDEQGKWGA